MSEDIPKIAYIGIYPPKAPRDKVYLDELKRRGVSVVECVSNTSGLSKYREIYQHLRARIRDIDLVWVGYLSPMAVLVAYFATRKKILYNALGSAYEAYVLDRAVCKPFSLKAFELWFSDFLAFHMAHTILVESEAQKKYLARRYCVSMKKLKVVYTGVDEEIFHPDSAIRKQSEFTVAFRGMFIPATGVEIVLEAARLLRDEPIHFWISGWGQLQEKVVRYIEQNDLKNVELNTVFLEPSALRQKLLSSHVLLGQFSKNSRLDRTIQHKTTEALALGQAFITRDSVSNREILTDGENCLLVQAEDASALADSIRRLMKDSTTLQKLSIGAHEAYSRKLSPSVLGAAVEEVISFYLSRLRTK